MYKLSDDVLIHNEDDEQYLINSSTGKVFLLNDVAALIIKGLKNEMLINDINSYISAEFPDIPPEQICSDVKEYIILLKKNKSIMKTC